MERAFFRIVDQIYDGAVDPQAWPIALGSLCEAVGGHHAVAMIRGADGSTPFIASAGVDPAYLGRFSDNAAQMDPLIRSLTVGTAYHRAAILPDAQAARSDFYNGVIRPMEGFRAILSVPFRRGRYGGLLAVCRPRRTADFSDEEAAALGAMVPHVARALKLRLDAAIAMRLAAVTLETLDRTDAAIAVVDADLRPVILSRRAADILAQGDGLVRSRQGLAAGTHGETLLLRRRVRRAAAEDPRIAARHALRLTRAPPRPPWSLTLHRLDAESAAAGEPLVAIFMEDASPGPMDIAAALNAMFELTPRETAVAVALARGRDLAETAAGLGVAAGTARNYLKAVFLKTGTRRQGELISLILRLNRFSR